MSLECSFASFRSAIAELQLGETIDRSELTAERFLLKQEGDLKVFYAPFDYVNPKAKITLVGVTPGWTQMHQSFVVARRGIEAGNSDDVILQEVKRTAAFAGSMRTNLIAMLDDIGIPRATGISTAGDLFTPDGESMMHATSTIRYPVFKTGKNYTGSNPKILRSPILTEYVGLLGDELDAAKSSLVVPLGKSVESAIHELVRRERIDPQRCLLGFPHPSGANAHRLRQFEKERDRLSTKVRRWNAPRPQVR